LKILWGKPINSHINFRPHPHRRPNCFPCFLQIWRTLAKSSCILRLLTTEGIEGSPQAGYIYSGHLLENLCVFVYTSVTAKLEFLHFSL